MHVSHLRAIGLGWLSWHRGWDNHIALGVGRLVGPEHVRRGEGNHDQAQNRLAGRPQAIGIRRCATPPINPDGIAPSGTTHVCAGT